MASVRHYTIVNIVSARKNAEERRRRVLEVDHGYELRQPEGGKTSSSIMAGYNSEEDVGNMESNNVQTPRMRLQLLGSKTQKVKEKRPEKQL